jgi:serine/threonine protein kinase
VYSLGVILFVLLFKTFPRRATNSGVPFTVAPQLWETKSAKVRNLLTRMLNEDPKKRPTISEVCNDDWLTNLKEGIETTCYNTMEHIRMQLPPRTRDVSSYPYKSESTGSREDPTQPGFSRTTSAGMP